MKDLKDFIHLYLGCEYIIAFGNGNTTSPLKIDGDTINNFSKGRIVNIKLLLRPLSSMTEEEAEQIGIWNWWKANGDTDIDMSKIYWISQTFLPSHFVSLLSKGFDLFGLIEEGLAIDSSKLAQTPASGK